MNTHRAYAGADALLACWVRDGSAKVDLSGELACVVYAYGTSKERATLAVESDEAGKATVTVSEGADLEPGLYRFAITADGAVVYDGLLDVV